MRTEFLRAMIESMHCDPALLQVWGVTIAADPARAQS